MNDQNSKEKKTESTDGISPSEIQKIAHLSRLSLNPDEIEKYSSQLNQVLGYFKQISSVKTDGVEPLVTPSEIEMVWREDRAIKELSAQELVENAPQKTGNLFTVPPVV